MNAFEYGPRDFPEDAIKYEDNGAYSNMCLVCRTRFIGHKRRNCCKACLAERDQEAAQQRADDAPETVKQPPATN